MFGVKFFKNDEFLTKKIQNLNFLTVLNNLSIVSDTERIKRYY